MTTVSVIIGLQAWLFLSQGTGTIEGTVVDGTSGEPIEWGNVVVTHTTKGAMTDADGRFVIKDVPAGVHRVRVLIAGYQSQTLRDVVVLPGSTTHLYSAVGRGAGLAPQSQKPRPPLFRQWGDRAGAVWREPPGATWGVIKALYQKSKIDSIALKTGVVKMGDEFYL